MNKLYINIIYYDAFFVAIPTPINGPESMAAGHRKVFTRVGLWAFSFSLAGKGRACRFCGFELGMCCGCCPRH